MDLSIVFPMFWGSEKKQIVEEDDHYYDHPTAIDDEGTIPQLFESLEVLKDRAVEQRAEELLNKYANQAGVKLHFFSYSHLQRLHAYLRELGKDDLMEAVSLLGYSPLRNACLVAAHILNKDIAVSIDDDCLFIEPDYVGRIKAKMLSDFEGQPIRAY